MLTDNDDFEQKIIKKYGLESLVEIEPLKVFVAEVQTKLNIFFTQYPNLPDNQKKLIELMFKVHEMHNSGVRQGNKNIRLDNPFTPVINQLARYLRNEECTFEFALENLVLHDLVKTSLENMENKDLYLSLARSRLENSLARDNS